VNFVTDTLKVWLLLVGLNTVMASVVGWPPLVIFPKLAETGSIHVVASAETERFWRPPPCAVGPMSCVPVIASLTNKSARLASADLICAGDQSGCNANSTAAEPAMCGVDIEVPWKNAQPEPSSGQPAPLFTHVIELKTFTPTEVTSGLTAKSTKVGPWPLKPAKKSLCSGVMNCSNVKLAEAVVAPDARSAAPS